MEELILQLPEIKFRHQSFCGSKAVNLGVIAREMKTPPGFCLSAAVYTEALKETGIFNEVTALAAACRDQDLPYINQASEKISRLIWGMPFPAAAAAALADAYAALSAENAEPQVAVRSSATAEDLPSASFAGQMRASCLFPPCPSCLRR